MIVTLAIYHGYTRGEPDPMTIRKTLQNKDTALALLYISRFLSGWSAGNSHSYSLNKYTQNHARFRYVLCGVHYLPDGHQSENNTW